MKPQSKILFVNQPVSMQKRYGSQSKMGNITPPLTLCHLGALALKHGYPTAILDAAALGLSMEETAERIEKESPRYLGMYATTVTIGEAAQLARLAKARLPWLKVIVGGVHITFQPEETLRRYPVFDVGVVGEGDVTLTELLAAFEAGSPPGNVRGIIFRKGDALVRTGERRPIEHLDALPMPAFHLLEGFPHIYRPPFFGFTALPIATAITSRGCPSKCRFCNSGIFGHGKQRTNSPKYIVELMRLLEARHGVRQLLFYDDNFGTYREHVAEMCERIIEAGLRMTWSCNTRVTDVTLEILALMKRAGCWQISFGIESGSQRVLNFMRKGTSLALIRQALKWTREAGIRTNGYFLFGFPTETEEELKQTISLAKSLDLDIFQCTLFTPFPTIPFATEIGKYGSLKTSEWGEMNIFNPIFVSYGFSPEKLERYKRKALREFYLRPKVQLNLFRMLADNPTMIPPYLQTAVDFVAFALVPSKKAPMSRRDVSPKPSRKGRAKAGVSPSPLIETPSLS